MKARCTMAALAMMAAALGWIGMGVAPAQEAPRTCAWGGNPVEPTGTFTIEPGVRTLPAPEPLKLHATGPAQGDACGDTVTFVGVLRAGSTCAVPHFEGRVKGVPGVESFWGPGLSAVMANEFLYDGDGNHVGFNNPSVLNRDLLEQIAENGVACNSPEGFTHGRFSSTIELFR